MSLCLLWLYGVYAVLHICRDSTSFCWCVTVSLWCIWQNTGLSIDDVALTIWWVLDLHRDFVAASNGAVVTLWTIQIQPCAGTLAQYLPKRKRSIPLSRTFCLESPVSRYDLYASCLHVWFLLASAGKFCLTEVGHGLTLPTWNTAELMLMAIFVLNTFFPCRKVCCFLPNLVLLWKSSFWYCLQVYVTHNPCRLPLCSHCLGETQSGHRGSWIRPFNVQKERWAHHVSRCNRKWDTLGSAITISWPDCRRPCIVNSSQPVNHSLTYFDHVMLPHPPCLVHPNPFLVHFHDIHFSGRSRVCCNHYSSCVQLQLLVMIGRSATAFAALFWVLLNHPSQ